MKKTIKDAIVEALKIKPQSPKEIYETILSKDLYKFNAKSPQSLVTSELRKHCEGVNLKTSSAKKYFRILDNGNYSLL